MAEDIYEDPKDKASSKPPTQPEYKADEVLSFYAATPSQPTERNKNLPTVSIDQHMLPEVGDGALKAPAAPGATPLGKMEIVDKKKAGSGALDDQPQPKERPIVITLPVAKDGPVPAPGRGYGKLVDDTPSPPSPTPGKDTPAVAAKPEPPKAKPDERPLIVRPAGGYGKLDADDPQPKAKPDVRPLIVRPEGGYGKLDANEAPPKVPERKVDLETSRKVLYEVARKEGVDLNKVTEYTRALEGRAKRDWLTPEQIAKTYDNISEMLLAKKSFVPDPKRIGMELFQNIAYNRNINQSFHDTCNTGALEVYAATREPDKLSRWVKEVVLTGSVETTAGIVKIPKGALMPGSDERSGDKSGGTNDVRNHASQIAQMSLINAVYQANKYYDADGKLQKYQYLLDPDEKKVLIDAPGRVPKKIVVTIPGDKLVDETGAPVLDKDGKPKKQPGFTERHIQEAAKLLMGNEMPALKGPRKPKDAPEDAPWRYDLPTKERLFQYKENRQLPLLVQTSGGGHVQTIHDITQVGDKTWILLDNQRGAKLDGWVTLDELHKSQQDKFFILPVRDQPNGNFKRPEFLPSGYAPTPGPIKTSQRQPRELLPSRGWAAAA